MPRKPKKSRKQPVAAHAPEKRDPLDDVIEESVRSLGLEIDNAWKPVIRANLQATLRHGALVTAFALDDETEPAPVFEP